MTHIPLKTWRLWIKHGFIILIQNKKMEHPLFRFAKKDNHDNMNWKDQNVVFLGLRQSQYNYDSLPWKRINHHRTLLLEFPDEIAEEKVWKTQKWGPPIA